MAMPYLASLPMQSLEPSSRPTPLYRDPNLQIIFGVLLISILGVSSITPTFPKLAEALNIPPKNIGLLVTVFTFPTVVVGPILGVLADRWGRKPILIPSLFLFGLAGAACALARDFQVLLVLRSLQGIGAASLLSLGVTLIGDLYVGERRTAAMGWASSVSSIGTASYPIIGGALALFGWYYPFLLPIAAIPVGLWVLWGLQNPEPKGSLDFQIYLRNVGQSLRNRQIVGLFICSAANFVLLYGAHVTYLPLLIAQRFQSSAFEIGLLLSSVSVAIAISSSQLGNLNQQFSTRTLILASFVLYAIAFLIVPFVSHLWLLLVPTTIFGIGLGIGFPTIQTLLAELAPKEYLAAVISVNGTFFGLGQTLGPLLMGIVFSWGGINSVFFAAIGFAIAILFIFRACTCFEG